MTQTTTTIRVSVTTHQTLAELSRLTNMPIAELTAKAVDRYRRELLFAQANADYEVMRADPVASAVFDAEHELWAGLPDGLEGV